jgi:hypothetical protein
MSLNDLLIAATQPRIDSRSLSHSRSRKAHKSILVSGSLCLALSLAACTTSEPLAHRQGQWADRCKPSVTSLSSSAGQQWMREHGWRYGNEEEAAQAYQRVLTQSSPWPDWFKPHKTKLTPGTRFQMVLSKDQPDDRPGGYGTFDYVATPSQARDDLAIRTDWKPTLDRVVIYEVTTPLPANVGPIATQIDPQTCRLLPGKWSQIELLVPPANRMNYLRILSTRSL